MTGCYPSKSCDENCASAGCRWVVKAADYLKLSAVSAQESIESLLDDFARLRDFAVGRTKPCSKHYSLTSQGVISCIVRQEAEDMMSHMSL